MKNTENFNRIASDKRWMNMMGAMKTTRQELQTLAPNPKKPAGKKGPELVKDDRRADSSNDRDATLGSMLAESLLGGDMGALCSDMLDMPEWTQDVNWSNVIQVYDEYHSDRAQSRSKEKNPTGSYSDQFNITAKPTPAPSAEDKAWERYLRDLPNRRVLEQNLGAMNRELDRMEKKSLKQQKLAFSM